MVRVVTPGTLIEPGLLQGDRNNYLVGVVLDGDAVSAAGIAYADITTGEFAATELAGRRRAQPPARRTGPPATRPKSCCRRT